MSGSNTLKECILNWYAFMEILQRVQSIINLNIYVMQDIKRAPFPYPVIYKLFLLQLMFMFVPQQ